MENLLSLKRTARIFAVLNAVALQRSTVKPTKVFITDFLYPVYHVVMQLKEKTHGIGIFVVQNAYPNGVNVS